MRSFLGTLAVVVLVVAGVYLYLQQGPQRAETSPEQVADAHPAVQDQSAAAEEKLEQEARDYIRDITTLQQQPLSAQNADNFVQRDQTIRLLPETKVEEVTPRQLLADPNLEPDTPLTVIKEVEQIEIVTPDTLRERNPSDPDQPIKVLEGDLIKETTVGEVLDQHGAAGDAPITLVKEVEEVRAMTAREIQQDPSLAADEKIKIVRGRQRLDEATVAELMPSQEGSDADAIYYIRTVKATDKQGIWGIIQYGLVDNFATGIAIRRGEDIDTYRVDIPRDADEMVNGQTSSFLGKMIHAKSSDTYVYNFEKGRMGHNPNMIRPGQELLIIRFSAEELVAIYKHFVNSRA
ncbi:MAG: hypothetical protein ACT4NU_06930 [Chromatiales bacterium]